MLRDLVTELYDIGAIQIGVERELKNGLLSPVYVDLRFLCSHPSVLSLVGAALHQLISQVEREEQIKFQRVYGIPEAGRELAVATGLAGNRPVIWSRKEAKDYGTRKEIEGLYEEGDLVAAVDDVITDGGAKKEPILRFRLRGLSIDHVIVICDRQQGGAETLAAIGCKLHACFQLPGAIEKLRSDGHIDQVTAKTALDYLKDPLAYKDNRERQERREQRRIDEIVA